MVHCVERFDKVIAKMKWCSFFPHSVVSCYHTMKCYSQFLRIKTVIRTTWSSTANRQSVCLHRSAPGLKCDLDLLPFDLKI